MAFDNVHDDISDDFSRNKVISSPEMRVENKNRRLDYVELGVHPIMAFRMAGKMIRTC